MSVKLFRKTTTRIAALLSLLLLISSCSLKPGERTVTLALKKKDKIFVYSSLGEFILNNYMEEGKTPPAVPITGFVFVGDEYFLNPAGMKDVINILAGNVTVFNFEEASYDGYLCEKEKGTKVFDKEYDTRSTETVGKNSDVVTVAIRKESGKEMKIMWQRSPELKAIKNCEIKSVQVNRSIQPGETTITWEDRIVVSVQSLLDFYDNKYRMEYDGENEVVYLVEQ